MCPLPIHRRLLSAAMSADRLLPDIVALSPSGLDDWERCPRLYLNRHLLRLPASDDGAASGLGNLVHDLLRLLHDSGDCHDEVVQHELLENHGVEDNTAIGAMIRQHVARCPSPAPALGHEREVVRLRRGSPVWIGSGRLDAVWDHDGILDVRDYKTGAPRDGALADDSRARFQAWLAAPLAEGRRIRVRYEHLGHDISADPLEYEPDPDDLARTEIELTAVVDAIRHAAAREEFVGVRERETCRTCAYRSICPDSAAVGTPTWPLPDDAGPAGATS